MGGADFPVCLRSRRGLRAYGVSSQAGGANRSLGGKKIYEKTYDGVAILDEAAVNVVLPRGTTPLLLKVGNAESGWGFFCRVTDRDAQPLRGVTWTLRPPAG